MQHPLPPDPFDPLWNVRERARIRRQVLDCQACPLHADCRSPVPFSVPKTPLDAATLRQVDGRYGWAVVGEAPGQQEDEQGRPFVGKSGKLLRNMIREAGLDPDVVTYINTISCRPTEGKGRTKKNRAPSDAEMVACRHNLLGQLYASQVPYVVLCGAVSLKAFRSDLTISSVRGRIYTWLDNWTVMPTFHPSYILHNMDSRGTVVGDFRRWKGVVDDPALRFSNYPGCSRCNDEAATWDVDGVGYCEVHLPRWEKQWQKERQKWEKAEAKVRIGRQEMLQSNLPGF